MRRMSLNRAALPLVLLAVLARPSQGQTNLWVGLTNTGVAQYWTNVSNWALASVPNSTGAVANFNVDLQSNLTVALGLSGPITNPAPVNITNNGVLFTDIGSGTDNSMVIGDTGDTLNFFVFAGANAFVSNNNTLTIRTNVRFLNGVLIKSGSGTLSLDTENIIGEGDGVWQNVLGGTLSFGGGGNAPYVDWTAINKTNGAGTLQLNRVSDFDDNFELVVVLPTNHNVGVGTMYLNDTAPVLVTNDFVKTGNGVLSLSGGLAFHGSNDITVAAGQLQIRSESNLFYQGSNLVFDGDITVNSNAIYWAISDFNSNTQLGTTNGVTTVNELGQLRFQNMTNNLAYAEHITLNSTRGDGSLYFDQAEVNLTGPITLGTNTILNVRMVNNLQRDATVSGTIDDGAGSYNVVFAGQNVTAQDSNYLSRARMILTGSNTYGGNTYVTLRNELSASGQTMSLVLSNGNNRLPTGTTVFLGGTGFAQLSGANGAANGRMVLAGVTQQLAGLETIGTGTNNGVVGGSSIMSLLDLNIGGTRTNIFGGYIGGTHQDENNLMLQKSGTGMLVLTNNANSYIGGTRIASGLLVLGNPGDGSGTLGSVGPGWVTNDGTLVLAASGGTHTFSNLVAGSGDLVKIGGSTITLAGSNSYLGDTILMQGILNLAGPTQDIVRGDLIISIGNTGLTARAQLMDSNQIADTSVVYISHPGSSGEARFVLNGFDEVFGGLSGTQATRPLIVEAASDNVPNRPATMTLNVAAGEGYSYRGLLRDAAGAGGSNSLLSVVKVGLGTQEFAGGSVNYTGPTTITQGVLRLTDATAFRSVVTNDAMLELNRTSGSHTHIAGIHGIGDLSKVGSGTITLTNNNTYTGSTFVRQGRLDILGNQSAATGLVSVFSGATLGGTGIIGGATFIQNGGIHAPGVGAGIETFSLGMTYSNNAVLQWELLANAAGTRGLQFDGVDLSGGELNVLSGADLSLLFNSAGSAVVWTNSFWDIAHPQQWLVIDLAGSATTNGATALFDIASVSVDSIGATLTKGYFYTSYGLGGDLYLGYAIPEPEEWILTLVGLSIMGWVGWRRRQRDA
ncbi:MAG TPA: autotransporter-associated beta strand repeat-containing protein [Verrucomicrobiae bacterium]|nr:autotransporter-associated beta strand repeat-containing protein [Verrucomicrobiae bacterium]